ncbi:hypothetical protein [Enterococcus sp. 5H]|uniref:hypothetical protein n=1 Tax=Enterococcus sp. 5H TaxID=1229490 RepID=UPI0023032AFE|nr:hypothetical protein [Enterococcus sp. 5H]MDA9472033.1 hypothetical protein [Enterococcus sp. 5H]
MLTILSIDLKAEAVNEIQLAFGDQLKPVGQLVSANERLVLIATEGNQPAVEMKEIITQLMLHKHFKLYKQQQDPEPIYGCREEKKRLIL